MNNSDKVIICGLIFFLLCCTASYFAGRVKGRRIGWEKGYEAGFVAGYNEPHPADTSATIDTSHYEAPAPVAVAPAQPKDDGRERLLLGTIADLQARLDSLAAVKPDTAFVEVPVPIEVRVYEDSTYRAQVSGYRPALDWIETYAKTTTITQYIEPPAPSRWSFGLTGGLGVVWSDGMRFGPGIVAGLSFRF